MSLKRLLPFRPTAQVGLLFALLVGGCSLVGNATPVPSPTASPSPSPVATPTATVAPTPSAIPTVGPCRSADLAARITAWSAGAGHRMADVELTNAGGAPCTIAALSQPQLVDGKGAVLIDGAAPGPSATLTIAAGGVLKTLVQDGNYCGPTPAPPVTVAFVLGAGRGRVVAAPLSATDTSGVPPCSGPAGSAGDIEMQAWAP